MDATLFGYLDLGLDEAASRTRAIVDACRHHRGDAVLLYHNDSLWGRHRRTHFAELVEEIARPA